MACYVDPLRPVTYAAWNRACHLVADSEAELDAMAGRIGLPTRCRQPDRYGGHYDLVRRKRQAAVACGAVEFTSRQMGRWLRARRKGTTDGHR